MAKEHPVPIDTLGCYKSGNQTLQVHSKRIIVNGNSTPEVDVRYEVTNVGRQIEMVNGSWLELNQAKPPHKQVGRDTIIIVEDNALFAFTSNGDAIPFVRVMPPAKCGNVVDRLSPTASGLSPFHHLSPSRSRERGYDRRKRNGGCLTAKRSGGNRPTLGRSWMVSPSSLRP